jgi:hypothetical protein
MTRTPAVLPCILRCALTLWSVVPVTTSCIMLDWTALHSKYEVRETPVCGLDLTPLKQRAMSHNAKVQY